MFKSVYAFINSRMWLRFILPLSLLIIAIMGAIAWYNINFQTNASNSQLKNQNEVLSQAIKGSMFDALAIGDNDTVRAQFRRFNETIQGLRVYVYDFNGVVSFSTDETTVGKNMSDIMGKEACDDLAQMLETGVSSGEGCSQMLEGTSFLLNNDVILNEQRCFHCHGQAHKILGGVSVFSSQAHALSTIQKGKRASLMIGLAGLSIMIIFVWLFFHFLVNQKVHKVLNAMSYLRQKDFSHSYDIGEGDEINHIFSRINIVTADLRATIEQINTHSGTINDAATDLTRISEDLNTASTDVSDKATTVSAAAEEMSASNQSVAESMDQSTQKLSSVAAAIEEMSATVSEIAKNVSASKDTSHSVVQGFDTITRVVDELGQRANDVDVITDEISTIAEQVSMLALNAKIEAARAGEAGKGFAVVAEEITELADKTHASTVQADEKLNWIKEQSAQVAREVKDTTRLIQESDDAVSGISAAVEEQNSATQELAANVVEVSSQLDGVNQNVTESAAAASDISKEISDVEAEVRRVQESSQALNDNALALLSMAENFMALVKQFKI